MISRWRVDFIGKALRTLDTVEAADERPAIARAAGAGDQIAIGKQVRRSAGHAGAHANLKLTFDLDHEGIGAPHRLKLAQCYFRR
jgi:hypothetical protein